MSRKTERVEVTYADLISLESLFQAWNEFRKGKKSRLDVQTFERFLEDNLFELHVALKNKTYKHGNYHAFYVQDPKIRHIHKASVADRVVHHLLYKFLSESLKLELHPKKIIFRRLDWGIDFLGYIVLPHYRLPRTKTKKRIFKQIERKIGTDNFNQSIQSYWGIWVTQKVIDYARNSKIRFWIHYAERKTMP